MNRTPLLLVCAVALGVSACGDGVTVQGRPTTVPTAAATSYAPPSRPVRTPTPRPTATEERRTAPGPETTLKTAGGTLALRVVTYSWQQTKFGERSVPPQNRYLVLDLELTAVDGNPTVLPVNFSTIQPGGQPTAPTFGRDGNEPVLAHKQLKPGESVRGFMAFDLPQAETTLQVADELGTKAGEVKIPAA